jgi:HAD superfamily hydrolase (TIGR01484 family)
MSTTNSSAQKKLILLDLDGTLLNNAGNISKYSIQILKRLNDDGHIICLLTGRTLQSTLKIYKKINLSTICICYNGALIAIPTSKNNFKYVAPTNIKFPYKLFNSLDRLTEIRNIIIHTTKFNYLLRKSTRSDLIT